MSKSDVKSERLREMERLYIQQAWSDIELAKRFDVDRGTIRRDRLRLESKVQFEKDATGRRYINRTAYISEIRVDLFEALALYLAARRFSRQSQGGQTHLVRGLEKLAHALHNPMTQRLVNTAAGIEQSQLDPQRIKVVETVAKAWAENHNLSIMYRALGAHQVKNHKVKPFLIEPSQWSDSVYLIGYSSLNRAIVSFKLDRIERAILSSAEIDNIPDFDEQTLLQQAWGIWLSDDKPQPVRLRFTAGIATKRIQESVWHPKQTITPDPDSGGCLWEAPIADWREMLPWIRGWGADCEVLGPDDLRETLMGEAKAMAEQYGWFVSSTKNNESSTLDDFWED
ncbi:MAG: helix-turn-helix transcriptional regulator [Candidatus Promineifilaceae bacterium]